MLRFYQAGDDIEAQLLVDYLASFHISAELLGRYQSGAAGELGAFNYPWIWLREARDEARAKTLLAQFLERRQVAVAGDSWRCERCQIEHEAAFDLCWQCGQGRAL